MKQLNLQRGDKIFIKDNLLNEIFKVIITEINDVEIYFNILENKEIVPKYQYRELNQIEFLSKKLNQEETFEYRNKFNIYTCSNNLIKGIVSRREIENFSIDNFKQLNKNENTVLISITDPKSKKLSKFILDQFEEKISIQFWDIEEDFAQYKIISQKQGREIFDFINKNRDKNFLIHCEAGISRSAGVGLAVVCGIDCNWDKYLFKTSPNIISSHPRYCPNLTVFDTIYNCSLKSEL